LDADADTPPFTNVTNICDKEKEEVEYSYQLYILFGLDLCPPPPSPALLLLKDFFKSVSERKLSFLG
jgi:hypothetical protein